MTHGDDSAALRKSPMLAIGLLALALCVLLGAAAARAVPGPVRTAYAPGKLVPIPASVPHEDGDMVDRRIVPNLRWLAERFPIYVTDGYSGKLPNGKHVGCRGCHVKNSDHHNGLAVDIVPVRWSSRCDRNWRGITRLARWAEPRQNRPRPPFRWVGYSRDSGHGCGHHLHLSWDHAPTREFKLAKWVSVFPAGNGVSGKAPVGAAPPPEPTSPPPPQGGVSTTRAGGISARGD